MNCATPSAPAQLCARGLNRLSCQINRTKNGIGTSFSTAAWSRIRQRSAPPFREGVGAGSASDGVCASLMTNAEDRTAAAMTMALEEFVRVWANVYSGAKL